MLTKIVSGGQTGADRAALDAALENMLAAGGFCPRGRKAEDGPIPEYYPLVEIDGGYLARTRRNVENSDGTILFYCETVQGGTEQTLVHCIRQRLPYKLIDISLVSVTEAVAAVARFITSFDVETLNVAGPRQSDCPEIYVYVKQVIAQIIAKAT